ncbi:MAG: serine/threonine-protein kinase [Deltaproteobacteria bacterium]|nr:serine/threonine-protein kinase [Deltaproteobacteria bacterium]
MLGPSTVADPNDNAWEQDTQFSAEVGETLPAAPRTSPAADPVRVGRFVMLDRIGAGGMGVVYAAYDQQLDRKIAIKLLHGGGQGEQAQARIMREAQAMARVSHPNVAAVYEVGTHEGCVFLAMELVRGQTITQWREQRPRTIEEIAEVFCQAGRGLATAHGAGLVHRDFKPANALVGDDGRVRVLDFGLARPGQTAGVRRTAVPGDIERHDNLSTELTREGQLVGTPPYMAPELFRGAIADPRSDQFAFSVALFETAFGRRPFAAENLPALAAAVSAGRPATVPLQTPKQRWIHAVIMRGLATDPDDRYPSMDALIEALGSVPRRRTPVWLAGGIVGLTALAGAGAWALRADAPDLPGCEMPLSQVEWDDTRRTRLGTAMAPNNASAGERVTAWVDDYVERWQAHASQVCAPQPTAEPEVVKLVRAQRQCLGVRSAELASLLTAIEAAPPDTQAGASRALHSLHPPVRCMEPSHLAALEPGIDPAPLLDRVMQIRLELGAAQACHDRGDASGAVVIARQARREAEGIDVPSLRAHAMFVVSYMLFASGSGPEAYALAEEANFAAAAGDDGFRKVLNLAWLAIVADLLGRDEDAVAAKAQADGEAKSLAPDPELEAWFAFFEGTALGLPSPERIGRLRRSVELFAQVYGDDSQEVVGTAHNLGEALIDVGQLDEAYTLLDQRRQLLERELGANVSHVVWEYASLARIRAEQGRLDEAIALTDRALANATAGAPDNERVRAVALEMRGAIEAQAGRADAGIASLRTALGHYETETPNPHEAAKLRVQIGLTQLARGNVAEARTELRAAEASLSEVLSLRELRAHQLHGVLTTLSAWACFELGDSADAAVLLERLGDEDVEGVTAYLRLRVAEAGGAPDPALRAEAVAQLALPRPATDRDVRWRALRERATTWMAGPPAQDPPSTPVGDVQPPG